MDLQAILERIKEQAARLSSSLTSGQKLGIEFTALVVMGGLGLLIALAGRTDWRPVFTRLMPEDASAISERLTEDRVPYRLEHDGTAILVLVDRVHEVRLQLTAAGLPKGGGVGFELFDDADPWAGKREQEIQLRRALEGELARTIGRIDGVRSAKVHLALPKESLFVEEERKPTASVMIYLEAGRALSARQVEGITRLVSAGVEGMAVDGVAVVDSSGRLLTENDEGGVATAQEYRGKLEQQLEQAARNILEPLVGAGKALVEVTADVDFSKVRETSEEFDDEKVVVSREQRTSEKRDPAAPGPGGVPGARAPTPEGMQVVGGALSSERKQEDVSYAIPKTTRTVEGAVGNLRRLSVAVLVDGTYVPLVGAEPAEDGSTASEYKARTPQELEGYEALVKRAVGFRDGRDEIEVVNERFRPDEVAPEEPLPWWEWLRTLVPWLVALVIGLLLVLYGLRPIVRFATAPAEARVPMLTAEEAELALAEGVGPAAPGVRARKETIELEAMADPAAAIREYARQDPQRAAQILRRWLAKN